MAKARKTISVDDLWKFERVGAPALSPDGAQLVCTLQSFSMEENKGHTSLWLLSTFGGGWNAPFLTIVTEVIDIRALTNTVSAP